MSKKKTLREQIQEWTDKFGMTHEGAVALLQEMTQDELLRCWHAAKDMRIQCHYTGPLLRIGEQVPPTMRYGTPTDIGLQMMDAFKGAR